MEGKEGGKKRAGEDKGQGETRGREGDEKGMREGDERKG